MIGHCTIARVRELISTMPGSSPVWMRVASSAAIEDLRARLRELPWHEGSPRLVADIAAIRVGRVQEWF